MNHRTQKAHSPLEPRGLRLHVSIAASLALFGVLLTPSVSADDAAPAPTFYEHVAPILNNNCVSCHQSGEIGPMSLLSYEETRPWAKSIRDAVAGGEMPPWDADPGFGPWTNDRTLSEKEIETLVSWVDSGAARGNPALAPPAPELKDGGWTLGTPDVVLEFPEVSVPAGGPDQFHNLKIPTDFGEDRWITAIEVLPGNREVVHHVILWQYELGQSPNGQGWLGAWAAGAEPNLFPEGTGRLLEAGAPIVGDMHYHPTDEAATDVTKIGLWFADPEEIEKELVNLWIMNYEFEIPAGDPNYRTTATHTFTQDSHLISLAPHMHYRGKDFSYTATYPDGTTEELLKVSDYDFNWQTAYEFEEPRAMPKGTRIDCVAHFDNSEGNPDNPDPTRSVTFGPESFDEMMIGFADYIVDDGIRPSGDVPDPMIAKLEELKERYPGSVFTIRVPAGPGGEMRDGALVLPREGKGGWYVSLGNFVGRAPLETITWTGNDVEADAMIPGQGSIKLKGRLNDETGLLQLVIAAEGQGAMPAQAHRAN